MFSYLHVFGNRDTGAFLPPVLQGIQAKIRQRSGFRMIVDAENPAGLTGLVIIEARNLKLDIRGFFNLHLAWYS